MKYARIVSIALLLSSCQSNVGTGILAGSALGAGFGGMAGGGRGALIGGAAGIIAGGLIGVVLDEQDRKVMERSSPRTVDRMERGDPLTINDVIKLSQSGVSDETIIHYMKETQISYNLSHAQIRRLQEAGVSERVVSYMVDSGQ